MIRLCCPACKGQLAGAGSELVCGDCSKTFPLVDSIPVFSETDAFYEGRWCEPDLSNGSLRNWLIKKQRFFVQRIRQKGALLDLGCGGGWQVFSRPGETAGIDLSLVSLKASSSVYNVVALSSLLALPFPDESFDFVVSSDVLGHIELAQKDQVIGEIYRVLRRGGRTLHYIETDSNDPLVRFEKKDNRLYEKYIIAPEGHIGLETPMATFERFRRSGFHPKTEKPSYKFLLYTNRVIQCLDNEYKDRSRLVAASVVFSRLIARSKALEAAANVGVALALEVTDRLLPTSWANGVLVEYEKR